MLEKGLFDLLDQLDGFIRMNALEAMIVLLAVALIGGMGVIRMVRRLRKSTGFPTSDPQSPRLGWLIHAPGKPPHGDPPPLADPAAGPPGDWRD
jgi:hypothetical protein